MSDIVTVAPELLDTGLRRRSRVPVSIAISLVIVALVVACALFGDLIAPHDPDAQDLSTGITGASSGHPLGTDELGRDVLSRIIAGARTAVLGPVVIAVGAMLVSSLFGVLAGYRGGLADGVIMRICDLMYALPVDRVHQRPGHRGRLQHGQLEEQGDGRAHRQAERHA